MYAQEKLGLPEAEQGPVIRKMVEKYIEGVCWVMKYYYEGAPLLCPSGTIRVKPSSPPHTVGTLQPATMLCLRFKPQSWGVQWRLKCVNVTHPAIAGAV